MPMEYVLLFLQKEKGSIFSNVILILILYRCEEVWCSWSFQVAAPKRIYKKTTKENIPKKVFWGTKQSVRKWMNLCALMVMAYTPRVALSTNWLLNWIQLLDAKKENNFINWYLRLVSFNSINWISGWLFYLNRNKWQYPFVVHTILLCVDIASACFRVKNSISFLFVFPSNVCDQFNNNNKNTFSELLRIIHGLVGQYIHIYIIQLMLCSHLFTFIHAFKQSVLPVWGALARRTHDSNVLNFFLHWKFVVPIKSGINKKANQNDYFDFEFFTGYQTHTDTQIISILGLVGWRCLLVSVFYIFRVYLSRVSLWSQP